MTTDRAQRASRRAVLGGLAAACAAPALAKPSAYRAPRNALGQPDLSGIWTNGYYTRLERGKAFTSLAISPAEAAKAEALFRKTGNFLGLVDPLGQKDSEFWDVGSGLARVRGEIRTSWIVDPPDGRIPFRPELEALLRVRPQDDDPPLDDPETQSVMTRCVASEGGAPPNINSPDGNFLQILQTRDHVALLAEKYHDLRIVRLGGRHDPPAVQSWLGDPVGRWEGETLVIESANLCPSTIERVGRIKVSRATTMVEKFTRTAPDELLYEFAVTDPTFYTQTWRAEMPFRASPGPIYEYTCHEGNYALPAMMAATRKAEREAAARTPQVAP
jgi:hypothetical protein